MLPKLSRLSMASVCHCMKMPDTAPENPEWFHGLNCSLNAKGKRPKDGNSSIAYSMGTKPRLSPHEVSRFRV